MSTETKQRAPWEVSRDLDIAIHNMSELSRERDELNQRCADQASVLYCLRVELAAARALTREAGDEGGKA